MATSGLGFPHLQMAFKKDGENGLSELLKENTNNKPRVTSNRKILDAVVSFFKKSQLPGKYLPGRLCACREPLPLD